MQPTVTKVAWSVSVGRNSEPCKTAEPTEVPFGKWTPKKPCLRSGPGSLSTDICGHAQSRTWSIYAVMWPLTTVNMAVEPRLFLTVICNMLTAHSHTSQQLWFCMCCFVFSSESAARASAAEKVQDRISAYGLFSYITHTLTLSHTHTTA